MTTVNAPPLDVGRLTAARNAVFLVFALNGIAFATWASRIPDAKSALGLTAGELGATLLFMSVGSLIGLPASGWVSGRVGAAGAVRIGLGSMLVGMAVVGLGIDVFESRLVVGLGLFALGLGVGVWDVGMNLEGASVERLLGRTIMPRFHAAFSGGTVASALVGAGMSALGGPVTAHLVVVAVLVAVVGVWSVRDFLPRSLEADEAAGTDELDEATRGQVDGEGQVDGDDPVIPGGPAPAAPAAAFGAAHAWTEPRTLLIGLLTLVAAFTEGTANDWLSVAFVEGYDLPAWAGVLAFAVFLSFMTVGRVVGTSLLDRYGRVPVLRVLFVLAGVGSLLVVFGGSVLAYVGAAVWGVGVSLGFPVGMSAAADDADRAPARISVVATIGYTAFIAGPPLLGFLGDHVGVLRALLVVGALLVVALLVVPAVREPERDGSPGA